MANLAIKGHATRGNEVIEILEMLGGANKYSHCGESESYFFFIQDGLIDCDEVKYTADYVIYTLEEFLEKFPYKVGDKVHHIVDNENQIITDLIWDGDEDEVLYKTTNNFGYAYVNYLQPYKEETMEEEGTLVQIDLTREMCIADEVEVILGDYEFILKDGKTYFIKKKPQYPKTYEECAQILLERASIRNDIGHKGDLLIALQRLLVCRDAYWKIAGEQMGLGKPWALPFNENQDSDPIYFIVNKLGKIYKDNANIIINNRILAFPTAEIRDAFYENFKELIELCKELL